MIFLKTNKYMWLSYRLDNKFASRIFSVNRRDKKEIPASPQRGEFFPVRFSEAVLEVGTVSCKHFPWQ